MKKILAVALVAGAVAAPLASAHGDAHRSAKVRMVDYVFKGVVTSVAPDGVTIENARGLSRFARMSLNGATTFTVKLGDRTRVKAWRHWRFRPSTLETGDRVQILIRAPKRVSAPDLPAARFIIDRGPGKVVTPPVPPAPVPTTPVDPTPPPPPPPPPDEIFS